MKEKKIIGLTGTYCSGKNFAASLLEKYGIPALDVDKLGHKVIETEKERLLSCFGNDILAPDGFISRKLLGKKVFGETEKLIALEKIIHPAVNRETLLWIKERNENACVINAALLHRSQVFEILDAIILIEAPFLVRLLRAKKRDKLPWLSLIKRFMSQKNFRSQYFKEKTDIYRVSNFSGGTHAGAMENRMREILSHLGII